MERYAYVPSACCPPRRRGESTKSVCSDSEEWGLLRAERLQVAPVGMTARVSTLAQNHGLLYGILAVIIALGVGLLTGLAFAGCRKRATDTGEA